MVAPCGAAACCACCAGRAWTGRQALKLGLVDGLGDMRSIMQEQYGDKARLGPQGRRAGGRAGACSALTGRPEAVHGHDEGVEKFVTKAVGLPALPFNGGAAAVASPVAAVSDDA